MARKQTAKIWYQNALHKEIYFDGHYHDAMYKGAELMWKKLPNTPTTEWYGTIRQTVKARGKYYALVSTYKVYPPTSTSREYVGLAEYDESVGGWVIFMITNFEVFTYALIVTDYHFLLGNLFIYDDDEWVEFDHNLLEEDEWFSYDGKVYGKNNYYEYYSGSGCGLLRHIYEDDYFPIPILFEWNEFARVVGFGFNQENNKIYVIGKGQQYDEETEEIGLKYLVKVEYDVVKKQKGGNFIFFMCNEGFESDCDLTSFMICGIDHYLTVRVRYKMNKEDTEESFRLVFYKNNSQNNINGSEYFFNDEQMNGSASLFNTGSYYIIKKTTKNSIYQYEAWGGRSLVNMTKLNIPSETMLNYSMPYFEDSTNAYLCQATTRSAYYINMATNEVTFNQMNFFKEG